jgi:uncharacterized OB-fold protein
MSSLPPKPLPEPTDYSRPFWEACRKHELRVQRCQQCGALIHYPKVHCPHDGCDRFDWVQMSGRGSVYSFIVAQRAFHPGFKADLPYTVAVIELEEGPRMMSNVIGLDPDDVYIGMPVEVQFEDVNEEFSLPKFRPAKGASGKGGRP